MKSVTRWFAAGREDTRGEFMWKCMPIHVQALTTNTISPVRPMEMNPLEGDTEDEGEEVARRGEMQS